MAASLAVARIPAAAASPARAGAPGSLVPLGPPSVSFPRRAGPGAARLARFRPVASTPQEISEKVSESIKKAEEACTGNEQSGECAAAWDEVEELSAAASHARAREENADPLEKYCKDNPESDQCRTYDT